MPIAKRRVLLLYPRFPETYWGLQYSLPVIGRKSFMPPLGLLTVAALCPAERFEFRLVDLNCGPLREEDLAWADEVFLSAMMAQKRSLRELSARCRAAGKRVFLGGPHATASPEECAPLADVLVLGEAETVWGEVLADLEADSLRPRYQSEDKPDLSLTPVPRFDLVDVADYFTIPIQFSRGCPFQCEFCDIIVMFGRKPRTKSPAQIQAELSAVLATGYRGDIFFVDDNFIGNKKKTQEILEAIRAWNEAHQEPFEYTTEASVDLAQKPRLLQAMVDAKFRRVFLGIESPSAASLEETKKYQNLRASIEESVLTIASAGVNVMAGFIVGFNSDPANIYDLQIDLIRRLPVPMAMIARLEAAPGTPLYARMEAEGRLVSEREGFVPSRVGDSNIEPLGSLREVLREYRRVLTTIYAPKAFFARVFLANTVAPKPRSFLAGLRGLIAQLKIGLNYSTGLGGLWRFFASQPVAYRREAIRLFLRLLFRRPDRLGLYLGYVILGNHMHRFTFESAVPLLDEQIREADAKAAALASEQQRARRAPRRLPQLAAE